MKKDSQNFKKSATLSWKLLDYQLEKEDPPERIVKNPHKTEGEMMEDVEIEAWFKDSLKAMRIIREENESRFKTIYEGFIADLEYLKSLGRIDEDVVDFVKDINNFDF